MDPNLADEYGWRALLYAALKGHVAVTKLLLADPRVDPNACNKKGNNAITIAADAGHAPVLELLLAEENMTPTRPNTRRGGDLFDKVLKQVHMQTPQKKPEKKRRSHRTSYPTKVAYEIDPDDKRENDWPLLIGETTTVLKNAVSFWPIFPSS